MPGPLANRWVAGALFLVVGTFSACEPNTGEGVTCTHGRPVHERVFVNGSDVPLLTEPRPSAPQVVNERATAILKQTEYRTLSSAYGLMSLCRVPGFVQVKIVEIDGRSVDYGEIGWIAVNNVAGESPPDQQAGLLWNIDEDSTLSENQRKHVRDEALRILREEPRCQTVVFGARSERRRGQYFVTCSGEGIENFNVWFSLN